jgi:carboxyl-terminal processing protease
MIRFLSLRRGARAPLAARSARSPLASGLMLLSLASFLGAGAATALAPSAQDAPQAPDLAKLVREQVQGAASLPAEELWRRAASLRDLERKLEAKTLDAVVDPLLAAGSTGSTGSTGPNGSGGQKLSEGAILLLASVRLQGADPDVARLETLLEPLLKSSRSDIALGAAELFSNPAFKGLGESDKKQLLEALSVVAEDGNAAPELRLECATALHSHGGGEEHRKAWRLMNGFLSSTDPELRAQGALALARSNAEISGQLYEELRRLAAVPGERGRLADSYLEVERVRETLESKAKRREALQSGGAKTDEKPKSPSDPAQIFTTVMRLVQHGHLEGDKVKQEDLLDAAINGMLHSMDEHSAYMDTKDFAKFEQDLEAGYGGIGAYVQTDPDDHVFTITHPIYSGPAYKAGLMSDDKVVRVDDWPTLGQPTEDIIKRLKGRPGTDVKLYIWRRGMDPSKLDRPTEDMAVVIQRQAITIPTVQSQMLPGKIGLIAMREFSRVASSELREALIELQKQGLQGLILDLRNNPGGLLDEAVAVATPFLPKGSLVVKTESRVDPSASHYTQDEPILGADVPMAVLINRFSASASEIVAGALQDHGRAVLVGQRSFGKGSVQKLLTVPGLENDTYEDENDNGRHDNWEPLKKDWNGNGEFDFAPHVKLTIARYLLPSGRSIHRELDKDGKILDPGGVQPEIEVKARDMETWRLEEMIRVRDSYAPREYVDQHFEANKELFLQLAVNDKKDISRYPDFDAFLAKLNTPLPADDVRQLIRMEIRRRVQDLRGQEFPPGDFVEDAQLQEAIRVVLEKRGHKPSEIEDYKAAIPAESRARIPLAAVERQSVQETLDQIAAARRGDGKLTPDLLQRLQEILEKTLVTAGHD